jgi:trigger factor
MQTTLETLGQLERRLNVSLPMAEIDSEIDKRLHRLARTIKMPGFRPGKVPMKMVAQQYGPQVRSDVISDKVQASFSDAVREQKLRVAGYPRIEPRPQSEGGSGTLDFSAVFEVYPEVTLGNLGGETVTRPVAEVTPADVERTIETLRRQRTRFEAVDRPATAGDRLIVDFTGRIDGVEFPGGQARGFGLVLGDGRMLPEFETGLAAVKAGETRSFDVAFPADYHGKDVAGKLARFDVTVHAVEQPVLPELDESFAHGLGIASGRIDDLRAEVEQNLRLELKRKIEGRVKEQVMQALRRTSTLAIPKALVEMEVQSLAQRAYNEMRGAGAKPEDIKIEPQAFAAQAEERVALGLVLAELIRIEGLSAKPEKVRALIEETAQTYEQPAEVVKWHYAKPERLKDFEVLALEGNVVEWALGRMNVVEQPTTFEAVMNPQPATPVQA